MEKHEEAVIEIASTVRQLYEKKEPFRIYHGSTNTCRPPHGQRTIDISSLSNVISVDVKAKSIVVEPNVPMDRLVEATIEHGFVPEVVMEFPGITVGGGYAGSAGESSSFRYGYFSETVEWVEIVLATGEVVKASKEERADLFHGAAGALGTLGIVTLLQIRLIPAKRFVRTTTIRTSSTKEAVQLIRETTQQDDIDYVDGILFSKDHGAVITGVFTDDKPAATKAQTFSDPRDPWYYLHVQSTVSAEPVIEYVPTAEYLFRYDRGGFWVGRETFQYFKFLPFTKFTRRLLDDLMHTRMLYRGVGRTQGVIVQDPSLPYSTVESFIEHCAQDLKIWPLWLCPLRETQAPSFPPSTTLRGPSTEPKPMFNIGLWGYTSSDSKTFLAQNRRLENELTKLGGRKNLYSQTFYTEDEFWALYGREWYEELRQRYHATTLPSVYDKVKGGLEWNQRKMGFRARLVSLWPLRGILGMVWARRSGDYLLDRQATWKGGAD